MAEQQPQQFYQPMQMPQGMLPQGMMMPQQGIPQGAIPMPQQQFVQAPIAPAPVPVAVVAPVSDPVDQTVVVAGATPVKTEGLDVTVHDGIEIHKKPRRVVDTVFSPVIDDLVARINAIQIETSSNLRQVRDDIKKLKPMHNKALHTVLRHKRARGSGNTPANNTFTKPVPITDDMCDFLNEPHGSSFSRTQLVSRISSYAREKEITIPGKGSIIPDANLRLLFGTPEKDEKGDPTVIKHSHIQKFFKHNVLKLVAPVVAPVAPQ
jgi:hypothetical protein